jgi:hypothetical protein
MVFLVWYFCLRLVAKLATRGMYIVPGQPCLHHVMEEEQLYARIEICIETRFIITSTF